MSNVLLRSPSEQRKAAKEAEAGRGTNVWSIAGAPEDAAYVGIDRLATIVSNGAAIPGTVYKMLSEDARRILDTADVILAKGQGNYESLSNQGRHIFYVFLCKCDLFTWRFQVPRLTGMFVEEKPMDSRV